MNLDVVSCFKLHILLACSSGVAKPLVAEIFQERTKKDTGRCRLFNAVANQKRAASKIVHVHECTAPWTVIEMTLPVPDTFFFVQKIEVQSAEYKSVPRLHILKLGHSADPKEDNLKAKFF